MPDERPFPRPPKNPRMRRNGVERMDGVINFRDVSQATGAAVGGMAILFLIFWIYYNQKVM